MPVPVRMFVAAAAVLVFLPQIILAIFVAAIGGGIHVEILGVVLVHPNAMKVRAMTNDGGATTTRFGGGNTSAGRSRIVPTIVLRTLFNLI